MLHVPPPVVGAPYLLSGSLPFTGAGVIASGSTLPTAARVGQLFLHNPTGRAYLMEYDGSAWQPVHAYGTTTLYVNGSSGSDAQDKGFGTGSDAYASIQYAINQLPGSLYGSVTINLSGNTYRESVTIQGKDFTGEYTLTLQGTTADDLAATTFNSAANGGGNGSAGYGTITKTAAGWTVNAYRGLYVAVEGSGTGAGQKYLVHANTSDTITIVGRWDTVPGTANNTLRVYHPSTRITGSDSGADTTAVRAACVTVSNGQRGVILRDCLLNYATTYNLYVLNQAGCALYYCQIQNGSTYGALFGNAATSDTLDYVNFQSNGVADLGIFSGANISAARRSRCVGTAAAALGLYIQSGSLGALYESYVSQTGTGAIQVYVLQGGRLVTDGYLEVEGDADTSSNVILVSNAVHVVGTTYGAATTERSINSGGWGLLADTGGVSLGGQSITYSGNTSGTFTPVTGTAGGTTA